MFIQNETTALQAMEPVSESIATFKRFVEALDRFLKTNELGSATWDDADKPEFCEHGYEIATFNLRSPFGQNIIYFYVYTDGTVSGDNLSIEGPQSKISDYSWENAIQAVLKTVGVPQHKPLQRAKIDKAIEALSERSAREPGNGDIDLSRNARGEN